MFFYHCSISRGKGHDHFHREEKEKTQVDQEKRAKRTGGAERAKEHHSAGKSIFL